MRVIRKLCAILMLAGWTACVPTPTPVVVTPSAPRSVQFQTAGGMDVFGTLYPAAVSPAPAIVLMHGGGGRGDDWVRVGLVDWLHARSFAVLTIDYRGDWIEAGRAAVAKAKTLSGVDAARIATMGASVGGDGATDACAASVCLGVLAFSPVGSFQGIRYDDNVAKLEQAGRVAWCIASEGEGGCPKAEGQHYRMIVKPGIAHGIQLLAPTRGDDIWQDLEAFIRIVFNSSAALDIAY